MAGRRGKKKDTLAGRGCGALFFFVFFAFGAGFFLLLGKSFLDEIRVGREWDPVPCTVIAKEMLSFSDSDGSSYRPEFQFRYEYDGQVHTATGYKIMKFSSSHGWAQRRLDRYEVGGTYTCWVNPANPAEAVIEHGVGKGAFMLLLPLVFMAVGGIGVVAMFRKGSRRPSAAGVKRGAAECFPPLKTRKGRRLPVALRPEHSPAARLAGMFFFAAFWNGISWTAVIAMHKGGAPVWVWLLVGLFPLIGLFLIGLFVHQVLYILLTGDPVVEIESEPMTPGARSEVRITHPGVRALNSGEVRLLCREKASYQAGTKRITKTENVVEQVLATPSPTDVRRGMVVTAQVHLPPDAMHSFKARNNQVEWCFEVKLDIPGKPDVKLVFPFRVAAS